jgi:hypothetical protein
MAIDLRLYKLKKGSPHIPIVTSGDACGSISPTGSWVCTEAINHQMPHLAACTGRGLCCDPWVDIPGSSTGKYVDAQMIQDLEKQNQLTPSSTEAKGEPFKPSEEYQLVFMNRVKEALALASCLGHTFEFNASGIDQEETFKLLAAFHYLNNKWVESKCNSCGLTMFVETRHHVPMGGRPYKGEILNFRCEVK